jgi:hypothetical protein
MDCCDGDEDDDVLLEVSSEINVRVCKCTPSDGNDCTAMLEDTAAVLGLRQLYAGLPKGEISNRLNSDLQAGLTVLKDGCGVYVGWREKMKLCDRYYVCGRTYMEVLKVAPSTFYRYREVIRRNLC